AGASSASSSTTTGRRASPLQLFVLVHGIAGCEGDWKIWRERLELRGRQDWDVRASTSITAGARFSGDEVWKLGDVLVDEVLGWVGEIFSPCQDAPGAHPQPGGGAPDDGHLETSTSSSSLGEASAVPSLVLHFVCHSLGGVVLRAALPGIVGGLDGDPRVSYGQILTLNTPHLGVHTASWLMFWKNLSLLVPPALFRQVHQLTLQDGSDSEDDEGEDAAEGLEAAAGEQNGAAAELSRTALFVSPSQSGPPPQSGPSDVS
ncbi:unnamed protein product, partial [Prorocentrum cordatum]